MPNRRWEQPVANLFPSLAISICNNDENLSVSGLAEPVKSFQLHAASLSGLQRRENNQMLRSVQSVKQLSFQTGASGKAREVAKYRLGPKLVPRTKELLPSRI
jgi:hypothetical protein